MGPAPDEQGLVFTPSGTGFLASGPYGATAGAVSGPAEIQRTTDQGKTWATVWRGSGYRVTWVGVAGDRAVATALTGDGQRPVLLEGTRSGGSWRVVGVSVNRRAVPAVVGRSQVASAIAILWGSYQFHFLSPLVGFAAPDPMAGQATPFPGVLLRTTDGGRHWAPVRLPGGTPTGGLAFTGAERGFATGAVNGSLRSPRCPSGQIWATSDGGSSWHAVPATCSGYELTTLDFPDAKTGFAGGGQYLKYSGQGQELVMLETIDGGRRWSRVYRASVPGAVALDDNPFGEVAFLDLRDGTARCWSGRAGPATTVTG